MDEANADIGRFLEALAASQPAAPALHVPGRPSLTYADLGAQIRYIRDRLAGWDIGPGDVVAAVIPTRPEMAVACAAIPAAGAFAPFGPELSTAAYTELLTRLRPKALIVPRGIDHAVRAVARDCGVALIDLVPDASAPAGSFTLDLAESDRSLRERAPVPADVAYIVSTSGTTGRRKLVPSTHGRMLLRARIDGDWRALSPLDVGYHVVPMHLSKGLFTGIAVPLLRGSSMVCLPESDIDGILSSLDDYRPTWLTTTFTLAAEMLRRAPAFSAAVARSDLRFIHIGSGRLDPDEIDRVEQVFRAPVMVTLSMTEAGVVTSSPLPPRARKRGSTGVPVENAVAICNENGETCAVGEAGEIVVRGPLVFGGYLDDPQLTAESFRDGWFRTGDLGRVDDDGYFYVVGRSKDIINRGGQKISPAEIDSAIAAHSGVRAAAAFGIPHPTLGQEIAVAVVRNAGAALEVSDIVEQVRQRLGQRSVPRRVCFVDDLPRTDSGKIRRSELPRMLGLDRPPGAEVRSEPPPPLTPLEAALAALWASVLLVKDVGANDDFFLLGGDSLRGARLLASVKTAFGIDIPMPALFAEAATIGGMARMIEALRRPSVTAASDVQR